MERTIEAGQDGAVRLSLRVPVGRVDVRADAGVTRAAVRLRAESEQLQQVIEQARVRVADGVLDVVVPEVEGAGMTTVISHNGRGHVVMDGAVVIGQSLVISGGSIRVNGQTIHADGPVTVMSGGVGGGLVAEVVLPEGSSARVRTTSGEVVTTGALIEVDVETRSGDVTVAAADTVHAATGSGDVRVAQATAITAATGSGDITIGAVERLDARTGSGDVDVHGLRGRGRLRTGSGDIRLHTATTDVSASTGSGDITVQATPEVDTAALDLHTGRGRIRVG